MIEYLIGQIKEDNVSFHMPGHKGSAIYREFGFDEFVDNIMDCDITEIKGADNLFQPKGIIKKAEKLYEELYETKRSFLLVNGTTAGIIASVMASVAPGEKILMSRGCHKAVYNGVRLGSIKPIYIQPDSRKDMGVVGEISPKSVEKALAKDNDIKAVILPSPNYYGICSDISAIAKVVHKAGKVLIVDQAHGAHLKFFHKFGVGKAMPLAAEDCGADIVINSVHKTLGSFTQSAVLNLMSDRVCHMELADRLQLIQSTSPSYILMSSLVINGELILDHGKKLFKRWRENLDWFYENARGIKGIYQCNQKTFDKTKININLGSYGISGKALNQHLEMRGIISELVTGDIVMAMSGIGNVRKDYKRLLEAISEIIEGKIENKRGVVKGFDIPKPGQIRSHGNERVLKALEQSVGKVSAESITPYPPGIPFVCPGEEITQEAVTKLKRLRGEDKLIYGISDEGHIHIYKD